MTRVLAHRIVFNGQEHALSIAEISDDGKTVTIVPFAQEVANTTFANGTVFIVADGNGGWKIAKTPGG